MNVIEENQFLRQEVEKLRADLAAAESRLHLRLDELTDAEVKQILGRRFHIRRRRKFVGRDERRAGATAHARRSSSTGQS